MFKKIFIIHIIIILLIGCFSYSFADDSIDKVDIRGIEETIQTASIASDIPKINSRYAVIMDRDSKSIIYGKNESSKTKMASTTKIMTSLLVIENTNLDNIVEISAKAAGTGGSRLKLNKGDKISVKDLLYGLMLRSGNDAAVALAEYVGGSIPEFADMMNEKADELGLKNTHFETPHGLDSENHYTTAYELALLTDHALANKVFAEIVKTKSCTISVNGVSRVISNTNELLGNLDGVYGVKTGFTNGAGRCLVTAIKRNNLNVICVVLGADTKKDRTKDSINLIEYAFKNFENINISEKVEEEFTNWVSINSERISIKKGIKDGIKLKLAEYNLENYPIEKNSEDKINIEIESNLDLIAPVEKDYIIGKMIVNYNGTKILEIEILTDEEIRKKNILDYMFEITKGFGKL